jgi:hypothetical protein
MSVGGWNIRVTRLDEAKEQGMPTVEVLSSEQIAGRRRRLLECAGMPEQELKRRAEQYALTPEQMALLEELEDLDYLLRA